MTETRKERDVYIIVSLTQSPQSSQSFKYIVKYCGTGKDASRKGREDCKVLIIPLSPVVQTKRSHAKSAKFAKF